MLYKLNWNGRERQRAKINNRRPHCNHCIRKIPDRSNARASATNSATNETHQISTKKNRQITLKHFVNNNSFYLSNWIPRIFSLKITRWVPTNQQTSLVLSHPQGCVARPNKRRKKNNQKFASKQKTRKSTQNQCTRQRIYVKKNFRLKTKATKRTQQKDVRNRSAKHLMRTMSTCQLMCCFVESSDFDSSRCASGQNSFYSPFHCAADTLLCHSHWHRWWWRRWRWMMWIDHLFMFVCVQNRVQK